MVVKQQSFAFLLHCWKRSTSRFLSWHGVLALLEALLLAGSVHAELNLTRVLESSGPSVIEDDAVMQ